MRSRFVVILSLVALLAVMGLPPAPSSMPVSAAAGAEDAATVMADLAAAEPLDKVDGALLEAARVDPGQATWVVVQSDRNLDLARYSTFVHQFTWPAGEHVSILQVPAGSVLKLATLPGVYAVDSGALPTPVDRTDDPLLDYQVPARVDAAALREQLRAAPGWSPDTDSAGRVSGSGAPKPIGPQIGNGAETNGWYDVRKGHAASEAWDLGYRGEGVRVAVLDFANDFAHPDMHDTWAVLPAGSPYAGWPQVFDPNVGYIAIQDKTRPVDARATRRAGSGMIELYQTSTVTATQGVSGTMYTACFQPALYLTASQTFILDNADCNYKVPGTSKGGTLRFGHHPDANLVPLGAKPAQQVPGEWAGVLLVDEAAAGVYDTVYVDLDGDRDFTDEKPLSKADPLAWRDATGDGIADVSGGLLYWISDGANPFPTSWLWGLEEDVPPAGQYIGILRAESSHGTMCSSNIVGQGVLKMPPDRDLKFRDLPGDGQPPSTNMGMAPGASLVSVGNIYGDGSVIFAAGWRYVVFGEDRVSHDDDIQVASNSYGFSNIDNDGWEADSRLVDFYVRKYGPSTSFLVATGNGGPGYGTITGPKPSVALGIAASTQMGSTGMDSITDTQQITFGDIVAFSNRGPGALGRTGVTVAADGADASGAVPLNLVGNGAYANGTWGGTSRSTPVTAGAMALVYQAFRARTGAWPTWEEAKAALMGGARHAGYDTFTQGAGVLDAGDAVRIAAGKRGIYATPPEWTAGDFHGTSYRAFANVIVPGQSSTGKITLHNPTGTSVKATLSGQALRRIGSYGGTINTNNAIESVPSGSVPDYVWPIDRTKVPAGTELMIVRGAYPLTQYDQNRDNTPESYWTMSVLQHTDVNGDGKLWEDRDGNGAVGHQALTDTYVQLTWNGGSEELSAIQGAITVQLDEAGLSGDIAWFGQGCTNDERFQDVTGKIALIARGVCPFTEKIVNAQTAGAVAVIVYSDARPAIAMGGDATGVTVPGVMIENADGIALRDRLVAGTAVAGKMGVRHFRAVGLDGGTPTVWDKTEIQPYEYMRFNYDSAAHNVPSVTVHHPLERWADGIYVALSHSLKAAAVPTTTLQMRYDFYAYRPWAALRLAQTSVTIPPGGTVEVEATLSVDPGTPAGAQQGAIFVDYNRGNPSQIYLPAALKTFALGTTEATPSGSRVSQLISPRPSAQAGEADLLPGGYELPNLRTVIPVVANVAPVYNWTGAVTLGGADGYDPDAPYNNGGMWGSYRWDWRAESGDWRFYFIDADTAPANTSWLYRTTWDDPVDGESDIDTRIFGPTNDRYSDPDHPANRAEGEEDQSDPVWYGPYTMGLITRSPYVSNGGSLFAFNTSSGLAEDWLASPATEGLHEVMLDNVLFSGRQIDLPFRTEVGSVRLGAAAAEVSGDQCGKLGVTPTIALEGLNVRTYGLTSGMPESFTDVAVPQDDANDVASSTFKHDVVVTDEPAWFEITLDGEDDDDLDLWLLRDANADGTFAYPDEVVANSSGPAADELIVLPGDAVSGAYQVWVHGFAVNGESKFDLTIDVAAGDTVTLKDAPERMAAGQTTDLEVCVDTTQIPVDVTKGSGVIVFGPGGAPTLLKAPVRWTR
jgi:hypothetical protein